MCGADRLGGTGQLGQGHHWNVGTKQVVRDSTVQRVCGWASATEALPISPLAVGAWVLHPRYLGWPSGCCRTPCLLCLGLAGSTWSLLLGICPPVAPGSKEGGNKLFACLGLWFSFLPSPPPLLFLCRGGCFSPPCLLEVAGLHLIASALSQLLGWP